MTDTDAFQLTPLQERYLKKELIRRQIKHELDLLWQTDSLEKFGYPFGDDQEGDEKATRYESFPILRFVFDHSVSTFPFLNQSPGWQREFWHDRVERFLHVFSSRNISGSGDKSEMTKRQQISTKLENMVSLMMNAGIKASSGIEESVAPAEPSLDESDLLQQQQLQQLQLQQADSEDPNGHGHFDYGARYGGLEVNLIGVRIVSERASMSGKNKHAYFLVSSRRINRENKTTTVARRYKDFRRLRDDLLLEFPGREVPSLPTKNKSASKFLGREEDDSADASSISSLSTVSAGPNGSSSPDATPARSGLIPKFRHSKDAAVGLPDLPREKNRLTLRAFLLGIINDRQITESKALVTFLTHDPVTLTENDEHDVQRRHEMDSLRSSEQERFMAVARERAKDLEAHMAVFKKDLVQKNGLSRLIKAIKEKERIEDLPEEYHKVLEWARIELASTIYRLFVAQDNSTETFNQAVRIHGLLPYTALKVILRISNPIAMMRGVIDLFLAQPLGSRSLMQRIFSMTLNDDVRSLQKNIILLEKRIGDEIICEKIRNYVSLDYDQREQVKQEAITDNVELLTAVLKTEVFPPHLSGQEIIRVHMASMAWTKAVEGNNEALEKDLHLHVWLTWLLKLQSRRHDKEQMIGLVFESATSSLLKDIITIFYEPLANVYKTASIWKSVGDLQAFVDDLIDVVKRADHQNLSTDSNALVQSFIDLVARHEASFFNFVHQIHANDQAGLFESLMQWIDRILTFLREGLPKKFDLNELILANNVDRDKVMGEIGALMKYSAERKREAHERLQARLQASGNGNGVQAPRFGGLSSADFGLDEEDLANLALMENEQGMRVDEYQGDFGVNRLVEEERRARGNFDMDNDVAEVVSEIKPPKVSEMLKLVDPFVDQLRPEFVNFSDYTI